MSMLEGEEGVRADDDYAKGEAFVLRTTVNALMCLVGYCSSTVSPLCLCTHFVFWLGKRAFSGEALFVEARTVTVGNLVWQLAC